MHHGHVVDRQFLIPGRQGTTLLQPTDATLNHVALAIGSLVMCHRPTGTSLPLGLLGWDDCANAVLSQPLANVLRLIGFVPRKLLRTPSPMSAGTANGDGFEQPCKVRGLMGLTAGEQSG